ncbi:MAG: PE-PPE domain-containing protein [Mycobacterium sp.]
MKNFELPSSGLAASRVVGRVGVLAATLGVGAVWFSVGVAAADSSSDSGSATRAAHSRAAAHGPERPSAAPRAKRAVPAAAADAGGARRTSRAAAAAAQDVPEVADLGPAPAADSAPAADPVPAADPAPAADPVPAVQAPAPADETVTTFEATPESVEIATLTTAGPDPDVDTDSTPKDDVPLESAGPEIVRRTAVEPGPVAVAAPTFQPSVCTESSEGCAYILGASGVPIPSYDQAKVAYEWYLAPNSQNPGVDYTPQIIYTPEGAYPITGIKVLPLDISVQQGLTEVKNTIFATLGVNPDVPISYFGYSQSAIIGSLLQRDLQKSTGSPIEPGQIQYVTVGQEMNPNGGWFARFPGLVFNSTGIDFYGATPPNDTPETLNAYPTTNYALEYDGFADFPRYPMNALSVFNAVIGIFAIHIQYLNPGYFAKTYGTGLGAYDSVMGTEGPGVACNEGSPSCLALPTTTGPDGDQKYYFIKTPYLPMLLPLAQIPFIGKPLVALMQPALKVIVDLGYGDYAHGFGTPENQPDANVIVPFGMFPQVSPVEVATKLAAGVRQGINDFFKSFGAKGSVQQELAAMAQAVADRRANPFKVGDALGSIGDALTNVTARVSTALSATYATLLATADFLNAFLLPLQAYNTNIVLDSVKQMFSGELIKGLINAIGLPIAADVGMVTTVAVFQLIVWVEGLLAAFTGCGPAAPSYTPPSSCPAALG